MPTGRLFSGKVCQRVSARSGAATLQGMERDAREAQSTRGTLAISGLLTILGAGVVIALAGGGGGVGEALATLLLAIASLLVFVAATGWAVGLGIRASGRFPDPRSASSGPPPPPARPRRPLSEIEPLDPTS